jgi:hypothetical protein
MSARRVHARALDFRFQVVDRERRNDGGQMPWLPARADPHRLPVEMPAEPVLFDVTFIAI